MNKIQTVASVGYANDAVKETAGRATAETRRGIGPQDPWAGP